ncbi:MAG TPA: 50S ribosomal protein L9 [Tepidisphaeraceae bacterium]|nr:50S ribosomal protein L9 [Tepidisphaeraceae bacterium]
MANVKLLLQESIKHVGRVGDIVEVAPGYARNYLIPHGLAVQPTAGNIKKVEARRQEVLRQEKEIRDQQEAMVKQLAGVEVTLERRANELGHLYGAVSATDIARALKAQNFNVDADDVQLPGKLDRIEKYNVTIAFADDLTAEIKVWVAPDAESKALIDAHQKSAAEAPPPPSNFERNV